MNGLLGNSDIPFIKLNLLIKFLLNYFVLIGLYYSNNRRIEPELLKIIQYNSLIDQISSYTQDNQHLSAIYL